MSLPKRLSLFTVLTVSIGLFLALPGCNGEKPKSDKKDEKKDEKKADSAPSKTDPTTTTPRAELPKPEIVDLSSGVGKEAVDFLQSVKAGTARADRLSLGFVKAVGLPAELPSDKARGFSTDVAEGWLKRVGSEAGFAPPNYTKQAGDVAVFRGAVVGKPNGRYSLRMVQEGNAWKADWLSLSSVEAKRTPAGPSADAMLQDFAATAIVEAVCDRDAMPTIERSLVIASGLTPAFRAKLAPPFGSDKDQGFDFNRGVLALEAGKIGDKVESATLTPQGNDTYKIEVVRAGGAKAAYTIKLVRGTTPGQWLVENVTPL